MYHQVGRSGPAAVASWTVAPEQFRGHLAMLAEAGYTGMSVARWLVERERPAPGVRPVALTFDDGLAGNIEHALPALMERQWTATFFVISGSMGEHGFASAEDWRAAADQGMDVASHTATHPFMAVLGEQAARREMADSRAALEDATGHDVHGFSWPNGDAHRRGRRLLVETGYQWAATSRAAFATSGSDPLDLPRLAVRAGHTDEGLARLIDPAFSRRARMLAACQAKRLARTVLGRSLYARLQSRAAGDTSG
jgi:peptidoglycan/xylan/chitin deacetylase (PgdA/CDA1 family)